jgi:16S rRNA (adenine1518-N6/adenine1519-N6)-dimethyltransferase
MKTFNNSRKTPQLGQHFLQDGKVISEMLKAADINSEDNVLEVGPGKGILTAPLMDKAKHVYAIEKDGDLHFKLKKKYADKENITLYNQDIREFDLNSLPVGYKVAANIPYYLTGQLIRMLTTVANKPTVAVLMIQKEVAERLTAPAGHATILQLTSQVSADVELVTIVTRDKFNPPPAVDSAVVKFIFHKEPRVSPVEQAGFFKVLKHSFAGKRKKIANTLSSLTHLTKDELGEMLKSLSLSSDARPQELNLDQWLSFYEEIKKKTV